MSDAESMTKAMLETEADAETVPEAKATKAVINRLKAMLVDAPVCVRGDPSKVVGRITGITGVNELGEFTVTVELNDAGLAQYKSIVVSVKKVGVKSNEKEQEYVLCRVRIWFLKVVVVFLCLSAILLYALRVYIDRAVEAKRLDARPLQPGEYA